MRALRARWAASMWWAARLKLAILALLLAVLATVATVAVSSISCSAAQQAADVKYAEAGIKVSLRLCTLADAQPSMPGWEALVCQLDEVTAAALGVTSAPAVVPAGTMAKLRMAAADGG